MDLRNISKAVNQFHCYPPCNLKSCRQILENTNKAASFYRRILNRLNRHLNNNFMKFKAIRGVIPMKKDRERINVDFPEL